MTTADRTATRAANRVLADLVQAGGGTYERSTLLPFRPKDGFAVGIGGIRLPMADVTADKVLWACKAVATEHEASFVGTWLDDGIVYFDAVQYFAEDGEGRAARAAYQHGQKALYSFRLQASLTPGQMQWES